MKEVGYMDDKNVEDVPHNQELEDILEVSREETSIGSFNEFLPFRSNETLKNVLLGSDTGSQAKRKSSRLGRRYRRKPANAA